MGPVFRRQRHKRWQCLLDDCIWSDFGDGFIVYHRPSGKTHFMNEASSRLLRQILQSPKDFESIAAELGLSESVELSEEHLNQLTSTLRRLEQFGLIQRM